MPHLFVDISSHGFGHLAQTAPVLNRLAELTPDLRLTIRSGLPQERLRLRIQPPFGHIAAASDFGFVMIDALQIDHAATAHAYRQTHADFAARVRDESGFLDRLGVDAVLSDVSYLPLAGARRAGIPAIALCSLNWADLFGHFYGHETWGATIQAEILAAYRGAPFLRAAPCMPMDSLEHVINIDAIATQGEYRRVTLSESIGVSATTRVVLVALGGIPTRLPIKRWPLRDDFHWLVPRDWLPAGPRFHAIEDMTLPFPDLLRSVDAIVTKPGYGTFTEAACNGTAVLYQLRDAWPEQDCLIDWLQRHARCREISALQIHDGSFLDDLEACLQQAVPPAPTFDGDVQAARFLAERLA